MPKRTAADMFRITAIIGYIPELQNLSIPGIGSYILDEFGLKFCQTSIKRVTNDTYLADKITLSDDSAIITICSCFNDWEFYIYKVSQGKIELINSWNNAKLNAKAGTTSYGKITLKTEK